MASKKIIIGMTGASGSIFGLRLLEALKKSDVETHVIASKWAQRTMEHETSYSIDNLKDLANVYYGPGDMGAQISSGSYVTEGMVIAVTYTHQPLPTSDLV